MSFKDQAKTVLTAEEAKAKLWLQTNKSAAIAVVIAFVLGFVLRSII